MRGEERKESAPFSSPLAASSLPRAFSGGSLRSPLEMESLLATSGTRHVDRLHPSGSLLLKYQPTRLLRRLLLQVPPVNTVAYGHSGL